MPLLPFPLLFPELLTQSMWNTVSPEVQISARVGGKRNLRQSSSLCLSLPTLLYGQLSLPEAVAAFHTIGFKSCPCWACGPSGGLVASLTLIRSRSPAALSTIPRGAGAMWGKIQLCWGPVGSSVPGRKQTPSFRIPPSSGRLAPLSGH